MASSPPELPRTILWDQSPAPGVRLLTINRPERRNAIGAAEAQGLTAALTEFRNDDSARVLVITGAGTEAFCAGADLHAVAAMYGPEGGDGPEPLFDLNPDQPSSPTEGNIGPTRWTDLHKPIIAAVNGAAYAGGLEWACLAHLRIADRHASFGVTCRRWNVGLGDGGTQRLPRLIGLGRALDLIITGRVIGAAEAERIGLVNEVTASGHCVERSVELAGQIAALPQPALRTDLEATIRGYGEPLNRGLEIEAECFDRLLDQPELRTGATRFVQREHPDRRPDAAPLHLPGRAYSFAEKAHRGKLDRYGLGEFIAHPVGVAELVAPFGDEQMEAAAFLHDTVEKTEVTQEHLKREFGPGICDLVLTLSQDQSIEDSIERRAEHRRRILAAGSRPRLIYACDRIDGINRMTELLESGIDAEAIEAPRRIVAWRGDLEAIRQMDLPVDLVAAIDDGLSRLEALSS